MRHLLRVLRSVWIWAATFLLVALWVPLTGIVRLLDRDPLKRRTARCFRLLGRVVGKINTWNLHIAGEERLRTSETFVVVSNHQSFIDIPLIAHLKFDAKWLGKIELFRAPLFGWLMRMSGDIAVERGDKRKAAKAMLQCARYLRQHCSVVFFPEGTRSRHGELLPFNDGPFQLAVREKLRVLPLVIDGSGEALPRNTLLFSDRCKIYLHVLEPVSVEGLDLKNVAELRETVRQHMLDELTRIRA